MIPEGERANVGDAIAFIAESEAEVAEAKKRAGGSGGAAPAPAAPAPAAAAPAAAAPAPVRRTSLKALVIQTWSVVLSQSIRVCSCT